MKKSSSLKTRGTLIAMQTPGVDLLEGRDDLAVLWDLRVAPTHRCKGVGKKLFQFAEYEARSAGCIELKIETQNNNVPACRFYESRGCDLQQSHAGAYPKYSDEIQMIWMKRL